MSPLWCISRKAIVPKTKSKRNNIRRGRPWQRHPGDMLKDSNAMAGQSAESADTWILSRIICIPRNLVLKARQCCYGDAQTGALRKSPSHNPFLAAGTGMPCAKDWASRNNPAVLVLGKQGFS